MKWLIIMLWLIAACKTTQAPKENNSLANFQPDFSKGPPTIVYKTREDYAKYVPVILSEDKAAIVSYPGIKDVGSDGQFPMPTVLYDGYLLDHRGINKDVAFLGLTYKEYVSQEKPLSLDEMYKRIIDKDPLLELCDCGSQKAFTDIREQLNYLIEHDLLRNVCRVVK